MLTPEYLSNVPDPVLNLFRQVEEDILVDMARRISKMGVATETAQWQKWRLEQIQLTRSDVFARLSKVTGIAQQELRTLFQQAATQSIDVDNQIYQAADLATGSPNDNPELVQLLNAGMQQTGGTFQNLTRTTANTATGQFERALDRAWLQVSSGAFDYQSAIRQAIKGLAAAGMQSIQYPSGHVDTLEVAVRRAVLTGVGKTTGEICLANAEKMGCDLMEITAHAGARPSHATWQGKIVSLSGRKGYLTKSDIGYGTGPGFKGWNCRHDWFPFFEGLSESAYPRAEIERMNNATVSYNGKTLSMYDATQQQRYIERQIRKWKREYLMMDAAGMDTTQASIKLSHWRSVEKDFCMQTGLPKDNFRSQVNGFGRSQAGKALHISQRATTASAEINNTMKWPQIAKDNLFRDEALLSKRKNETAILYDPQGRALLVKKGGEHSVKFTPDETQKMRGLVLTHNHPYSTTFSWADIAMLGEAHLSEIRAAGEDGTFYMRRPAVWPKEINSVQKIKQAYFELESQVEPLIKKRLDAGEIDVVQYNQIYQMHLLDLFAAKYHLDYGYEKR